MTIGVGSSREKSSLENANDNEILISTHLPPSRATRPIPSHPVSSPVISRRLEQSHRVLAFSTDVCSKHAAAHRGHSRTMESAPMFDTETSHFDRIINRVQNRTHSAIEGASRIPAWLTWHYLVSQDMTWQPLQRADYMMTCPHLPRSRATRPIPSHPVPSRTVSPHPERSRARPTASKLLSRDDPTPCRGSIVRRSS